MKKYFYLVLLAITFNSCRKVYDQRPPTTFTTPPKTTQPGPAYTPPACNPGLNRTDAYVLNFQLYFPPVGPSVSMDKQTLTYYIKNDNNDELTVVLHPFVEEQSTVYTTSSSPINLGEYQSYIEFSANSLGSDKYLGKSTTQKVQKIHLEYDELSDNYTLVFCESPFVFNSPNGGGQFNEDISGKFNFSF
jgi:hypothetical protein